MALLGSHSKLMPVLQHPKPHHSVIPCSDTWPFLSQSISSSLVSTPKRIKQMQNSLLFSFILNPIAGAIPHLPQIGTIQNIALLRAEKTSQTQTEVASVIGSAFQSSTLLYLDLFKVLLSKFYLRKGFPSQNSILNYQRTKTLWDKSVWDGVVLSEISLPQFVPESFTPHWIENLSSDDYHADKSAVGSSSVKLIEEKSPRLA